MPFVFGGGFFDFYEFVVEEDGVVVHEVDAVVEEDYVLFAEPVVVGHAGRAIWPSVGRKALHRT